MDEVPVGKVAAALGSNLPKPDWNKRVDDEYVSMVLRECVEQIAGLTLLYLGTEDKPDEISATSRLIIHYIEHLLLEEKSNK